MIRSLFSVTLGLFASLSAADSPDQRFAPMGTEQLLETAGGLLLILSLIFVGAWLFKRYGRLPMAGKHLISVLGGVSVGPRERILLVKVEETRLVVGVAAGQVRTLHVLESVARTDSDFETHLETLRREEGES